jgi:hypothetical protein
MLRTYPQCETGSYLRYLERRDDADYARGWGITVMKALRRAMVVILWGSCISFSGIALAQIAVKNPNNLPLPTNKPQLMFKTACQVVAEEFRIGDPAKLDFPLTLVLGEPFRYTADDEKQAYTIYMDHWDDTQFTSSVVMLASHRVVTKERYKKIVVEALRRANRVAPVEVDALRK